MAFLADLKWRQQVLLYHISSSQKFLPTSCRKKDLAVQCPRFRGKKLIFLTGWSAGVFRVSRTVRRNGAILEGVGGPFFVREGKDTCDASSKIRADSVWGSVWIRVGTAVSAYWEGRGVFSMGWQSLPDSIVMAVFGELSWMVIMVGS